MQNDTTRIKCLNSNLVFLLYRYFFNLLIIQFPHQPYPLYINPLLRRTRLHSKSWSRLQEVSSCRYFRRTGSITNYPREVYCFVGGYLVTYKRRMLKLVLTVGIFVLTGENFVRGQRGGT